jgi:ADP-ribosyl-[dinitrogen reductase] hydrolase
MELNQVAGVPIGLAVGDALGVPVEFSSRESLRENPVKGLRGYGTYKQPPGTWSDDSSLAFCTAESLCHGFDTKDLGQRFVRWQREGYWAAHGHAFDIGTTTRTALQALSEGVEAEEAGPKNDWDNGNGSLMRILPVALRYGNEPLESLQDKAHRASKVTHGHHRSQMACGIYVYFAARLLSGEGIEDALQATIEQVKPYYSGHREFSRELDISTAYSLETLASFPKTLSKAAAMWCTHWRPLCGA